MHEIIVTVKSDAQGPILYIAPRLPELSETFVYRELLGLRSRGHKVIGASVRSPMNFKDDAILSPLAAESFVIYSAATLGAVPMALVRQPRLAWSAFRDPLIADHPSILSRMKHFVQALMGIGAGWRLRHHGIRHVHAHMAHVPTMISLYIAQTLRVQFSFTGHAADLFVNRAALAFKLNRAAFVACISDWHRAFYREAAPLAANRLPVIRCSVALPDTVHGETQEIVTVARLVPKKGVDLLIHAFAHATNVGDWSLRIIGGGSDRAKLEAMAESCGVADRVIFEGAQPHLRCLEAIASAGLFVLACRTAANGDKDGIPVVLMEAMAAARAVIAGDLPAIQELIENERSGLLVLPNNVDALARAIDTLVSDTTFRRALGAKARLRIESEFSDQLNLDRLSAAFDAAKAAA